MVSTTIYSSKNGEDKLELHHNVKDEKVVIYSGGSSSPEDELIFHKEELIEFAKAIIKLCK